MSKASKAALLSGLVFPGAGHMLLQKYLRGSVLMIAALGASTVIIKNIVAQTLAVVDRINSGDIPADTGAIAEMVANSSSATDGFAANAAVIVLLACWLIGIVDAYRLGSAEDQRKI